MPVAPSTPPPVPVTVMQIITDALVEIGVNAAAETPVAEDASFAFRKLNDMLDEWAVDRLFVVAETFQLFNLVPGLQPHTIGPAPHPPGTNPTFVVPTDIRPTQLESASIVLNDGDTQVDIPVNIQDAGWWARNQTKNIQSSVPTDLYYEPDLPYGAIFWWPVPNFAYQARISYSLTLNAFTGLQQVVTLAPGYRSAIKLSLAERLCPGFSQPLDQTLARLAMNARKRITNQNAQSPSIGTMDAGMPKSGKPKPYFNWLNGSPL